MKKRTDQPSPQKRRNQTQSNPKKHGLKTTVGRILFVVAMGYFAVTLVSQQIDMATLKSRAAALDERIAEEERVQKENESLRQKIGTDEYTEDVARERLGFMKPDEKVFIASSGE